MALAEAPQRQRRVQQVHVRKAKKSLSSCQRDSFLVYGSYDVDTTTVKKQDDDDTASTLSTSTNTEEDDFLGFSKTVSFAEPLVTSVRTRQSTTREDKYYWHYNEHDYMDFKIEFLTGGQRCHRVSFDREVISDPVAPLTKHYDALYFSESELQQ